MKSIRTKITLWTVCAIVISVSIVALISAVSIKSLGNSDAEEMLLLMCETGEKNLNFYFDSVEQSVKTVSTLVEEDLSDCEKDELDEHIDRIRNVFENVAANTNGILTYYYRIDPEYTDSVSGFWYIKDESGGFIEHEVTDITQYDTNDTTKLVWFTVPKATGESIWLPPYITENLDVRVLSYNAPIYWRGRFIGVIGIEMDYSLMARVVDNIALLDHGYAFINDAEGNLIYHPLMDVATMTDETRPEVPDGLLSNDTYTHYNFEGYEKLGIGRPLDNGMRLNVSVPIVEINRRWEFMIWNILIASVILIIAASIVSMLYAEQHTKPLKDLTEATEQVNRGDYNIKLDYRGDDEVGILTKTFSNLVENLDEQIHALAELEQADAAKTAFLSNMSHEIRTPITTILGMNEIIMRECNQESILGYSQNIRKAGTSLLGIISDILDFSKINAGKMELFATPYLFTEMVGDLYNMVQFRAEEKGLSLRLEIDPHIPSGLTGDALRIKQVITNLLINAIKYTEKGSIILTILLAGSNDKTATLYFAVTDTGIGIREEEIDNLFKTFERLDTRRTHTIEGIGLGMTICRDMLEMMGSKISVESTYNEGSKFSFYLDQEISDPAEIGKFDETHITRPAVLQQDGFNFVAPESRILIVDDTPMNLEVIKGLLKPTQMQIDIARSGMECIEKFAVYPYDLVFMDYRMPHMNGIETLDALKESTPDKVLSTPIISLTANAIEGERERMLEAGFTDFLTKPVKIPDMEKVLVKYLPDDEVIFTEEDEEKQDNDPLEGIPKEALNLPWINPKEGVEYCGSVDMYFKAVELFTNTIDDKAELIEKCISEGDLENYTIAVHSLKSTSLSIGMEAFSKRARLLELAGKAEDIEQIKRDTPGFIEDLKGIKKDLNTLLQAQK